MAVANELVKRKRTEALSPQILHGIVVHTVSGCAVLPLTRRDVQRSVGPVSRRVLLLASVGLVVLVFVAMPAFASHISAVSVLFNLVGLVGLLALLAVATWVVASVWKAVR